MNNPDQYVLWPDENVTNALMNERLKLVRLQYRPVSGGEWITAKDESSIETDKKFNLLCADSRTEGCKFDWVINNQFEKLLSGFKDNVYELRLKNFCFGGPSLAETSVHEYVGDQILTLTVDTKRPLDILDFSSQQRVLGKSSMKTLIAVVSLWRSERYVRRAELQVARRPTCKSAKKRSEAHLSSSARTSFGATGRWMVEFPENEHGPICRQGGRRDGCGR